ncbi:MAG: hypothetical protein JWO78_933 [Micavibrio sp.]|nr:hypothetical protein [Micavibrio sp.]
MSEPTPPEEKQNAAFVVTPPQNSAPLPDPAEPDNIPPPTPLTLRETWTPTPIAEKCNARLKFDHGSYLGSSVIGGGIAAGLLTSAFYIAVTSVPPVPPQTNKIQHTGIVGLSLLSVPFIFICVLHTYLRKKTGQEIERRKNVPASLREP